MKIYYFTKPKEITLDCLKYMDDNDNGINITVVICDMSSYNNSDFFRFCMDRNIKICDADELCNQDSSEIVDVIISNTFPKRIPLRMIETSRICAINFHSAPLPQYRGTFGYNFALYNCEKEYGVTAHHLSSGYDEGDIIEVERFAIDYKKISLKELVKLSNEHLYSLFVRTFNKIRNGIKLERLPQNKNEAKYYSRGDFENLKRVELDDSIEIIDRKIHACWYPPYEGAYIEISGKRYMLMP